MTPQPARRRRANHSKTDPVTALNRHMAEAPIAPRWQHYFAPVAAFSDDLPVPIIGVMLLIWQLRERDLQQLFPLDNRESCLQFITWCMLHGRNEYCALQEAEQFWQAVNSPAQFDDNLGEELDQHDPGHAISWKMLLAAQSRPDLGFDVKTRIGRSHLLFWYVVYGRLELGFADEVFCPWQTRYLLSASSTPNLNHLQELIYLSRGDVRHALPLPAATSQYIIWFRQFISSETNIIAALRSPAKSQAPASVVPQEQGVNVIGYAYGQLGIGEDARMAFTALQSRDVPTTIINFSPGNDVSQNERGLAQFVTDQPRYDTNMFCLTAPEHGRCFAERGSSLFAGRFNIGYWPWELGRWPAQWQHLHSLVDEVWVSSPHTLSSVAASMPPAVRLMTMAVTVDDVSPKTRLDFGLPLNACLFLFAFDLNSSAKRKNPKACLAAFLHAFPRTASQRGKQKNMHEKVGLVIKVHPPKTPNPDWEELKQIAAQDDRIHLIEQTLSRGDLLALYRVCDCFVSLHRAEGFGRCIAEAMLLGKPVITTNYSGNLAFNDKQNALLVTYRLRKLAEGDYPFGLGQVWAEPSVQDAAQKMRLVFAGGSDLVALARRGQQHIEQFHQPRAIAQNYLQALRQIWRARAEAR